MTEDFVANAIDFAARRPIGVDERAIVGVKPAAGAGNSQQLVAANYIFDWTMEPFAGAEALLTVHANAVVGRHRGYFLPWEADAAISIDIDQGAEWCFTSTLTGCTVRVYPLVGGGVRMTHANAKAEYGRVFTPTSTAVSPTRAELQQADRMATAAAIGNITGMLGAAMPNQGLVTKRQYVANVSDVHMRAAKQRYRPPPGEHVKEMRAAETSGKPEVSCFVWGHRHAVHGWRFWYQSTVQIAGTLERKHFFSKNTTRLIYGQSVVLGQPEQFHP
jgi:hypothetical protein